MGKKALSLLLALAMVLVLVPGGALAVGIVDSGAYGEADARVSWTLDADGTLTISGNGEVNGLAFWEDDYVAPWTMLEYKYAIKSVVIQEGITGIQWRAFSNLTDLTSVTLPVTVTRIDMGAFDNCSGLSDIYYAGTRAQWAQVGIDTTLDRNVFLQNATTHCSDGVIPPAGIVPAANRCGDDLTWKLVDGTFTVQGTGEMWQFDNLLPAPWWEDEITSSIKRIEIKEGVTSVGYAAFGRDYYPNVTSVSFPSTLTYIREYAFSGCFNLTDIYYAGSEAQWKHVQIHDSWYDGEIGDNEPLFSAAIHYTSDPAIDESVLRARLLLQDNPFSFYRQWKSPVQTMAEQLDPKASKAWYYTENLLDAYYQAFKQTDLSLENVDEVTDVEFYEYLLLKLLDSEEMDYLSLTEPFGLVDDLSGGAVDTSLLKKLVSKGFKAGTKITDENKAPLKAACEAIYGEGNADIGWMDAILVPGKTIDEFASEFVKAYQLMTVSEARAEVIRLIGESSGERSLQLAAQNVYSSIQSAKEEGLEYCVSSGYEQSADYLSTFVLGKAVDGLCKLNPYSTVWKKTAETATFIMDTIFLTDDVSTDVLYITAMANLENALKKAIDKAEDAFRNEESVDNARHLVALADTYKRDLLIGCDLINDMIDHSERGELNWHGLLDLLSMKNMFDFGTTLKWMFGDKDSSYAQLRGQVTHIRDSIETTNFYLGSMSAIELLREVKSTTPSAWAEAEVAKAIRYGVLPEEMRNNYQSHITRLEFCLLVSCMIEEKTGKSMGELAEEWTQTQGGAIKPPFDDALYMAVNEVSSLGIINGVGNNSFAPLGEITRQEAASMLYRTANALGCDTTAAPSGFPGVADWASQGVDYTVSKGIMVGTGGDFDPLGKFTKEQAIITMVRFYENVR